MLSDPYVMTVPDWFRPILVNGIIIPLRQFSSTAHYELIWDNSLDDSPLIHQAKQLSEKLEELKQSLLELDVELEVKLNPNMHDREIRIDNGWVVKIGRGLDFFQKPGGWFEVGANDLSLRKCLETKVDIFRA